MDERTLRRLADLVEDWLATPEEATGEAEDPYARGLDEGVALGFRLAAFELAEVLGDRLVPADP